MTAGSRILIIDYGSQYTQLIARRVREQKVFSVVLPCTAKLDEITSYSPIGVAMPIDTKFCRHAPTSRRHVDSSTSKLDTRCSTA